MSSARSNRGSAAPHFTEDGVIRGAESRTHRQRMCSCGRLRRFSFEAPDPEPRSRSRKVQLFGNVAVATTRWKMRYEFGGRPSAESGHDTYVFTFADQRWRICWRAVASAQEH